MDGVNLHWKADISSEILDTIELVNEYADGWTTEFGHSLSEYFVVSEWIAKTRADLLKTVIRGDDE